MPPIHDLLGHVIDATRLRGRVFCQTVARPPWGLQFEARPGAAFHLVTAGSAIVLSAAREVVLAQGDLVVIPRGDRHAVVDHRRSKRLELAAWLAAHPEGEPVMRLGGARGPETRVLCGIYEFDGLGAHHPVLRLLPSVLHLPASRARAHRHLSETLTLLAQEHEAGERGSAVIVSRLLDVLLIQVIRAWAEDQPVGRAGWIGALTDAMLAKALAAMHGDLRRPWTVATLARAAGASRATLGRRFVAEVGEAPLAYLTRARLHEAAHLLQVVDDSLAAIADRVGYTSEFAFNRSFRRCFGVPPGAYRRQLRAARPQPSA
jgi:AraC-like DNA-binding protein